MAGMSEFAFSTKMRDTMVKMIEEGIQRVKPRDRYGVVSSLDLVNSKASVTLNGETSPVLVNMGTIQPAAVGAQVRVSGTPGDRYIADVYNGAYAEHRRVVPTAYTASTVPSSLPIYSTMMYMTGGEATTGGWPWGGVGGILRTTVVVVGGVFYVNQEFNSVGTVTYRNYRNGTGGTWGDWYDSHWIAVSGGVGFSNGWGNYGGGWQTARYRRLGDFVEIQGLVNSGTLNTSIFVLPTGFRPPAHVMFSVITNDKNNLGATVSGTTAAAGTGQTDSDSAVPNPNLSATVSSHAHGLQNHTHTHAHAGPSHTHTVTSTGSPNLPDGGGRLDVQSGGSVNQSSATHNGYQSMCVRFSLL